ncbi:hypothetical protein L5515_009476 [Caenorhabditis briggsae]|uniref:NR LBD domain-containing protein n=1 Tax=Caenorhabditis briggsae TaxID=6238 RepID=A0AAE9F850_CAEBR|nr:hypothetical protein L5515_009476 [Caenorhabditis briggsae]
MTRFSGKVALITGSSTGIGKATAILFAKEGAKVTVTGRNTQRFEETKQEILNAGIPEDHILAIATNLATEEGQDELINETIKKFGRLDILGKNRIAQDISVYDKIMLINMRSVVTLTQKALKFLIEAKGEIVNVSSMAAGPQAQPSVTYYAMSKTALDQFTRSIAIDLIQHGVRVNSVSPGVVKTSFGLIEGMLQDKSIRKSSFSCMSTGHSGKMQLRMVKGKSAGTVEGSVKFADFEKKFPVYNLCQSYFETTINIIFCSSSSTEAKMYKTRSSDAVSARKQMQGKVVEIGERVCDEMANNLHSYYLKEEMRSNYAGRLVRLMSVVNAVKKIHMERRKTMELARIFEVFKVEFSEPDIFDC